ncbi:MAG: biopolymer transporter ExbD [Bacteroidetes bacterium]|jgi:biopolymer transport protein ExbD|nr:MAG: biopolymer transporter ExbD [Bacteroidota bacterium]RLD67700.1 MAG: biopolymer transporter ExbD [Bacteroidota bacterium]RLD89241.1 MAG: biopolymer transporter ExbD [Bacteroidota bacterium]
MAIESRHKTNKNFSMSGMSDIVFLLLIFFMITSTLIVPAAQDVQLPESNNQTQSNPVLVVSIGQDKTIYVDDQVYVLSELEGVLRKKLENYGEAPTVRLNADRNLNMEEVFIFLDIAKRNRYKVILGTRPSG